MVDVIKIQGGLGNQMFQYAFFLAMRRKHPLRIYLFDIVDSQWQHQGFELFKLFPIHGNWRIKLYRLFHKIVPSAYLRKHTITQAVSLQYNPEIVSTKHLFPTLYSGYWQSEKYFLDIAPRIRNAFTFDSRLLNTPSRKLASTTLHKQLCVSIHIRRGDYLQYSRYDTCHLDYYQRALDFISERYSGITPIFFSNDMPWVREHFPIPHAIYVDWNQGPDCWQDMYLMSQCQHNIIANSTFSWWGAWLNAHTDKVVIAPKQWFNGVPNLDIIPINCIQL